MQVKDIMTTDVTCAEPTTSLEAIAQMMVECDCGGIPVCDPQSEKLVGFVTDRDIVCRTLAKGLDPLEMMALDAMTPNVKTVSPDATVDQCIQLMQTFKVRRVPVTDQQGYLMGIITQADLALKAVPEQPDIAEEFEEALEEISVPKTSM